MLEDKTGGTEGWRHGGSPNDRRMIRQIYDI